MSGIQKQERVVLVLHDHNSLRLHRISGVVVLSQEWARKGVSYYFYLGLTRKVGLTESLISQHNPSTW